MTGSEQLTIRYSALLPEGTIENDALLQRYISELNEIQEKAELLHAAGKTTTGATMADYDLADRELFFRTVDELSAIDAAQQAITSLFISRCRELWEQAGKPAFEKARIDAMARRILQLLADAGDFSAAIKLAMMTADDEAIAEGHTGEPDCPVCAREEAEALAQATQAQETTENGTAIPPQAGTDAEPVTLEKIVGGNSRRRAVKALS